LIWLLPAAVCSIAIALILKVNEGRAGNRLLIAGANYLVASAISFCMLGARLPRPGTAALVLGSAAGIVYVLGFLFLMAGIARLPLAVPVTVARLSVMLPVSLAILLWAEKPGPAQWLGLGLGVASIVLFGTNLQGSARMPGARGGSSLIIVPIFLTLGLGDVLLKAFRETAPDADRLAFTFVLFSVAALLTWSLVLLRRVRFDAGTFYLGLLLGVPNLFSTVFTLHALRSVPASIAFPLINLTVIAGSTLLALAIWKERLRALGLAGLFIAGCAIALLARR